VLNPQVDRDLQGSLIDTRLTTGDNLEVTVQHVG
jgi:hypothetical protein